MANVLIDESKMTNIANALRLKTGTTATFTVTQMPSVISNINTTFTPNLRNLEIYPSESSQAFSVASGYDGYGNITVYPVASDYIGTGVIRRSASDIVIGGPQVQVPKGYYSSAVSVAFPTAEHPAPTISFNSSTGIITATHSQSAGYTTGGATAASMALPSDYMPDPYYNIYKSLAFRSVINSSDPHVSEWANSLSSILYSQFAGQLFSGDFVFNNVKAIGNAAFGWLSPAGTIKRAQFTFPTCLSVNEGAFENNMHSLIINLPECTLLGNSAFQSAIYLEQINAPKVTKLQQYAFYFCNTIEEVNFPVVSMISNYCFGHDNALSTASFPNCTSIGGSAFAHCSNLTDIFIPQVSIISDYAFWNCRKLLTIDLPNLLQLGSYAFQGCSDLTSISLPLCEEVGMAAFSSCYSLREINMPECLAIGSSCFYGCSSLSSVNLPKVQTIAMYAFYYCSSLLEINLPMISSLGNYAFNGCVNLHTVSLSGTISSIGTWTFANCSKLLSVYLNTSSVIGVNTNAFMFTPISGYTTATGGVYGTIYVPSSLYSSYLTATGWSYLSSRLASF